MSNNSGQASTTRSGGRSPVISDKIARHIYEWLVDLSLVHRAGCMVFIMPSAKAKFYVQKHFIPMTGGLLPTRSQRALRPRIPENSDLVTSLAQSDGCLIFDEDGVALHWGMKLAVSVGGSFPQKNGRDVELERIRCELGGPGTKRWSALMASRVMKDVLVFTVSSDGPIKMYRNGKAISIL